LRLAAEVRIGLLLAFLLAAVAARAQVEKALPEAPVPVAASAHRAGESLYANSGGANRGIDVPTDAPVQYESTTPEDETLATTRLLAKAEGDEPAYEPVNEGVRIDLDALIAKMDRASTLHMGAGTAEETPQTTTERYHWKGLLWESFAFFGVENTQRLFADSYFRRLTADKPFWHDYLASVKQWNWRRWNDGDDFLVAYIAHPLQGSVTEFIEIQNNPRTRDLRITDGNAYWRSLFQSSLWATAYSFDQKLGPLGETALGSEGGYTYVVGCADPCRTYNPAVDKVTNNTGWVKLVTTPVVGTLWTMMEDSLDRFISDRVQGDDYTRVFPKILRGSLNPAHTLANALRWRKPWYRDYQHDAADVRITPRPHFLPGDDEVIFSSPKFDFFPHVYGISLPVNTAGCMHCRQSLTGYGFGFAGRIVSYADLDSDLNYVSNASPLPSDRAGGNILTGTFGLRSGYTNKFFSLKAYLRPGFLSYDHAYQSSPSATNPTPTIGRVTHFTTALGIDGDFSINRHLALRGSVGNQPVRYREPYAGAPGYGKLPYLSWLSKLTFLTNENWSYQAGPVVRF
jgi:hypothetical protein